MMWFDQSDYTGHQQRCAEQAQMSAIRSMNQTFGNALGGLWMPPSRAYPLRCSPPPLSDPQRTLSAGRPWMDVQ